MVFKKLKRKIYLLHVVEGKKCQGCNRPYIAVISKMVPVSVILTPDLSF